MTFDYEDERFAVQAFPVDGEWTWAYWISGLDQYCDSIARFASSESALANGSSTLKRRSATLGND
jgi:hypothetical protein